jgi:hypothetical protein
MEVSSPGKGGKMKRYRLEGLPGDIQQALIAAGKVDEWDMKLSQ